LGARVKDRCACPAFIVQGSLKALSGHPPILYADLISLYTAGWVLIIRLVDMTIILSRIKNRYFMVENKWKTVSKIKFL